MNNKMIRIGPTAIGTSGAVTCLASPGNISNGTGTGTTIANLYYIIRHIRILNTTSSGVAVSGFVAPTSSATNAGKEFLGSGLSVPANSYQDWYGYLRIDNGDFLNFFGASSGLTADAEGEVGVQ